MENAQALMALLATINEIIMFANRRPIVRTRGNDFGVVAPVIDDRAPRLPTSEESREWNELAKPEAGDARRMYLPTFCEFDAAIKRGAEAAKVWPTAPDDQVLASLLEFGREEKGCTRLIIELDGIPMLDEWIPRILEYRKAVQTRHQKLLQEGASIRPKAIVATVTDSSELTPLDLKQAYPD